MKLLLRPKMIFLVVGVLVSIVFAQGGPSEAREVPSDDDVVCMGGEQHSPFDVYRRYIVIDREVHRFFKEEFGPGLCSKFDINGEILEWVATCKKEESWCSGNEAYTIKDLRLWDEANCVTKHDETDYSIANESDCRDYIVTEEKDEVVMRPHLFE